MSKSIEEAKESRRNLLGQSSQNLKNTGRVQIYQETGKAKVQRSQEMIAVGVNIPSSFVYSERTIPPEKNKSRENAVCASINKCRAKNSSFDGQSAVELDVTTKSVGIRATNGTDTKACSPSPHDISKVSASEIIEASRMNFGLFCPEPVSGNKARKKQKRTPPPKREGQHAGRWTAEEHKLFLEGLKMHGREWKKVAEKITTRTSAQIRSHAQKYFSKLAKESGHLHPYDAYIGTHDHMNSHSSTDTLGESSVDTSKSGTIAPHVSPSLLQRIDRIMKNPVEVESEVESTLKSLRERYLQLQLRLQTQEKNKQQRITSYTQNRTIQYSNSPRVTILVPSSKIPIPTEIRDSPLFTPALAESKQPLHAQVRALGPATAALEQQQRSEDAESKMKSFRSESLSSRTKREFGSEELIALQVLGGELSDTTQTDKSTVTSSSKTCLNYSNMHSPNKKRKTSDLERNQYP